ncbi:hypothetical protein FACS1894190_12700 [Spirochaetia bacterium]|nr:hypothetical protein FACS1894190_12700 [Spirochaetia bacterium]
MSLFQEIFEMFFSKKSPQEKTQQNLLKFLAEDLKRNKFKDFYKSGKKEVLPAFGRFFFGLYKYVCKIQLRLRNADTSPELKNMVINFFLDQRITQLLKTFSKDELDNLINTSSAPDAIKKIEESIKIIYSELSNEWCFAVDSCYKTILSFLWFANFDFYDLLRKMDPKIPEFDAAFKPSFEKIKVQNILENLKDFLSISEGLDKSKNWNEAFKIIYNFNKNVSISYTAWMGLLSELEKVLSSSILTMIVRHGKGDPFWQNKIIVPHNKIASQYLNDITQEALNYVRKQTRNSSATKSNEIYKNIFGSSIRIISINYYTDDNKNGIDSSGFTFTNAYQYTMSFLAVFFDTLKDISDIFVIYGEWNIRDIPKDISAMMHDFTELYDKLKNFDKSLSDTGGYGERLKTLRGKSGIGKKSSEGLEYYLEQINNTVMQLITKEIDFLKKIGGNLVKFIDLISDSAFNPELKNAKPIIKILKDKGYNLTLMIEKINLFIELLKIEGFN